MSLTIRLAEARRSLCQDKKVWASTDVFFSLLFCPEQQHQQETETLTWSEASHSDRFLQGRVEFSFSSHVPSGVQNRYTCPCSTARSKTSHRVNGRRACCGGKGHRAVGGSVQAFFPTDGSPGWRGKPQRCWRRCFAHSLPVSVAAARSQGQGAAWEDTDAEGADGAYACTTANQPPSSSNSLKQLLPPLCVFYNTDKFQFTEMLAFK